MADVYLFITFLSKSRHVIVSMITHHSPCGYFVIAKQEPIAILLQRIELGM
jgi:hypothetical protein